jgi:hypothetical protein
VYTHHYGSASAYSGYTDVTVVGIHDAWVFGSPNLAAPDPAPGPVALHWNGRAWSSVPMPAGIHGPVIAVSALSSKDIWAVTDRAGYVMRWNGSHWRLVKHLVGGPVGSSLVGTGVLALSDRNVWVFGTSGFGPGIGTWHFDGRTWKPVPSLAATVSSASATSASNIWGVGDSMVGPAERVDHYDGHAWRNVTPASLASAAQKGEFQFGGAWAQSSTSTWVTGTTLKTGGARLYHVVGGKWTAQHLQWTADRLGEPVRDGNGGFWLLATAGGKEWIWHRTAMGKWSRSAFITGTFINVFSYAPVPTTSSFWAAGVGYPRTRAFSSAVVWAYGPLR